MALCLPLWWRSLSLSYHFLSTSRICCWVSFWTFSCTLGTMWLPIHYLFSKCSHCCSCWHTPTGCEALPVSCNSSLCTCTSHLSSMPLYSIFTISKWSPSQTRQGPIYYFHYLPSLLRWWLCGCCSAHLRNCPFQSNRSPRILLYFGTLGSYYLPICPRSTNSLRKCHRKLYNMFRCLRLVNFDNSLCHSL